MVDYFERGLCGKQSVSIPVLPFDASSNVSIYGNLLSLEDGEAMTINPDTVICYLNGQYFLVKSPTETKALYLLMLNNHVLE